MMYGAEEFAASLGRKYRNMNPSYDHCFRNAIRWIGPNADTIVPAEV